MLRQLKNLGRRIIPHQLFIQAQPIWHGFWSILSHFWYQKPSNQLIVIGVTGTKGKTSTAHIIYQTLNNMGVSCGIISTAIIDDGTGEKLNWFRMTQLSGPTTQQLLQTMVRNKLHYVVIEISSEGLAQNRHRGINFDIAVFTNLTPDHIEAHGSFENYKKAKGLLFQALSQHPITPAKQKINPNIQKTIVANTDSEHSQYYLSFSAQKKHTYGIISGETKGEIISNSPLSLELKINGVLTHIGISGEFNTYNILATVAIAQSLGFSDNTIKAAIEKIKVIPGRMEILQAKPFMVVIDYAHEKASMTALYSTISNWKRTSGKIIHVFGATGGVRDKSSRVDLGTIVGKNADITIITDEDPFDENPQDIIHAIADAAVAQGKIIKETLFRNPNRREAIQKAFSLTQPDDLVLITGKGAEQRIARANGTYEPWDDRVVAREELKRLHI